MKVTLCCPSRALMPSRRCLTDVSPFVQITISGGGGVSSTVGGAGVDLCNTWFEGLQWRQRAGEQAAPRLERSLWKRWMPQACAGSESVKFWRFATMSRALVTHVHYLRLPVGSLRKFWRVAAVAFAQRRLFGKIKALIAC
jgi:hypothetical protein